MDMPTSREEGKKKKILKEPALWEYNFGKLLPCVLFRNSEGRMNDGSDVLFDNLGVILKLNDKNR
jgi:hypothetical protein